MLIGHRCQIKAGLLQEKKKKKEKKINISNQVINAYDSQRKGWGDSYSNAAISIAAVK